LSLLQTQAVKRGKKKNRVGLAIGGKGGPVRAKGIIPKKEGGKGGGGGKKKKESEAHSLRPLRRSLPWWWAGE